MDITSIPPTVFVAFGVITAAFIAGFFSYLNLVSSKENKVSEFRLDWINGLRDEIAEYTSAIQELSRVHGSRLFDKHESDEKSEEDLGREWFKETKDAYARVTENLSKIQLRLNPKHISDHPNSDEAKLMAALKKAKKLFNKRKYRAAMDHSQKVKEAAAPLLKTTWDLVKKGEPGYQKIRKIATIITITGIVFISACFIGLCAYAAFSKKHESDKLTVKSISLQIESRANLSKGLQLPPASQSADFPASNDDK